MSDYDMNEYPEPPRERSKFSAFIARMGLGAFTVSLIVHAVFILLAVFFLYKWVYPPQEKVDFLPGGGGGGGNEGQTVNKIKQQRRMSSSSAVAKRIASTSTSSDFVLPDTSAELSDPGLPMTMSDAGAGSGGGAGGGRGTGIGTGTGSGTGPGKGFGNGQLGLGAVIPGLLRGRCTESERLSMLRNAGGTPAVEEAVKKSLAWFKTHQNADGSWGTSYPVGMTGLVLLCYLGHCENTQSPEYGETVSKAITYLIDKAMKNDGRIASSTVGNQWVYEHAIGTYALAEAYTFSKNLQFQIPNLDKTVTDAAHIIIGGQNGAGSWDYEYNVSTDRNDLSVAGWQMQALKASKASGLHINGLEEGMKKAIRWLTDADGPYLSDGKFAYTGKGPRASMTAVATLCLQQWEKGALSPARAGVKLISEGLDDRGKEAARRKYTGQEQSIYTVQWDSKDADLYSWYYASQVMRNAEGKDWREMNKAILEEILPAQNADGSFKAEGSGGTVVHVGTAGAGASRGIYAQALSTLILEVYYRFLPATSAGRASSSGLDGLDSLR